jgi:hypothetical protein
VCAMSAAMLRTHADQTARSTECGEPESKEAGRKPAKHTAWHAAKITAANAAALGHVNRTAAQLPLRSRMATPVSFTRPPNGNAAA